MQINHKVGFGFLLLMLIAGSVSVTSPALACEGVFIPDSIGDPRDLISSGGTFVKSKGTKVNGSGDPVTIQCFMEEVVVTAQRIGSFHFVPSLMNGYYRTSGVGPNGPVEIPEPADSDRVFEVDDTDPYANVNCGVDPEHRRPYASVAQGNMVARAQLWDRIDMLGMHGQPVRIRYPNGDTELWTVDAPSSPTLGLSSTPILDTCMENQVAECNEKPGCNYVNPSCNNWHLDRL